MIDRPTKTVVLEGRRPPSCTLPEPCERNQKWQHLGFRICLEQFTELGYLLSLDYSKCFDTLAPNPTAQLMKAWGLPRGLADICLDVWSHQVRLAGRDAYTRSRSALRSPSLRGIRLAPL